MHRLPTGHFYVNKLGKDSRVDDAKQIAKLKSDKITLKRRLQETRHNNGVLKNMVEQLNIKKEEIEGHLQESKAIIANGNAEIEFISKSFEQSKKENHDLEMKTEELEEENAKLKESQNKLASELDSFKSTDADLVISRQETKECNEDLQGQKTKYFQCFSENEELKATQTKLKSDLKICTVDLVISQKKLKKCSEDLEAEIQKNLQCEKDKKTCVNELEAEIEEKEVLKSKYESVCPSWSEWSDCSKTCWGIKTRIDRCSMYDDQINTCNQDSLCPKFGKFFTVNYQKGSLLRQNCIIM